MAGYSHRTLREKLGIKSGNRLYFHNAPAEVMADLGDLEEVTSVVGDPELANFSLFFIVTKSQAFQLAEKFQHLKAPDQMLWVAWPKKSSNVKTDLTEQDLRDALLPIGMVDVKVCAISDVYSGLKFVWRKK
jgi:hypothetical protein